MRLYSERWRGDRDSAASSDARKSAGRLAGQAVHQIQADVVKSGAARVRHGALHIRPAMDTAQRFQQRILHRLRAQREAIYARLAQGGQLGGIHRARVGLDGHFRPGRYVKAGLRLRQQAQKLLRAQAGGRAAAQVHRSDFQAFRAAHFIAHGRQHGGRHVLPARKRGEIAIRALARAEGNMQIQPDTVHASPVSPSSEPP